jgi:hypothetical protein
MSRLIDRLSRAIRTAAVFNPEVQTAPACVLSPDSDRQWEVVIPRLQDELPELLILGDYTPEKRIGPAIWLRCVLAKKIADVDMPEGRAPIFYLPGVSRQDLRAVENCPDHLKPLAELQYRGVIWSQINAKDWTILAFLKSDQGGLGLDVAQGNDAGTDFEPCVAETGQSLKGGYHLKKLLTGDGWKILERSENSDGQGNAWCEFGDIDHEGHDRGWKLAKYIDVLMGEIRDRVVALFSSGWKSVRVVTDHGWLLLPGGLPKIDMPSSLVENKWGRCAAIKPGASTEERIYPWFWNRNLHFALADGISCFRKGEEYTHGGLSLQECLTLELTVTKGSAESTTVDVEFTDVVWKGLRCAVAVDGQFSGLSIDVRTEAGNSLSSVVVGVKPLKDNGTASVVVENEDLEGTNATVVLLDENNELVAQVATVIGGDNE